MQIHKSGMYCIFFSFNPLPDDKIVALSKLKAFTDDKLNVTQNIEFIFHKLENIVGKGENAGNRNVFNRPFPKGRQRSLLCGTGCRLQPPFLQDVTRRRLKTLWEKEKIMVTSL